MRAKLYRGSYYAVWVEDGKTRRASLHTSDRDQAERNLADFKKALAGKTETVAEIMEAYLADRDGIATAPERLRYAWKALKPTFGHLRPDQIDRFLCRRYAATRGREGRDRHQGTDRPARRAALAGQAHARSDRNSIRRPAS